MLDDLFHEAVSAIDAGDVTTLERLLDANPQLVRERTRPPCIMRCGQAASMR